MIAREVPKSFPVTNSYGIRTAEWFGSRRSKGSDATKKQKREGANLCVCDRSLRGSLYRFAKVKEAEHTVVYLSRGTLRFTTLAVANQTTCPSTARKTTVTHLLGLIVPATNSMKRGFFLKKTCPNATRTSRIGDGKSSVDRNPSSSKCAVSCLDLDGLMRFVEKYRLEFIDILEASDIGDFTETNLTERNPAPQAPGLCYQHKVRKKNRKGGVSIFVRNCYECTKKPFLFSCLKLSTYRERKIK